MEVDLKKMLIISDQDMLRAGNQLLFRAIEGYLANNFKVYLITHAKSDSNLANITELFGDNHKEITVLRVPIKSPAYQILRNVKKLLKTKKQKFAKINQTITIEAKAHETVNFQLGNKSQLASYLYRKLWNDKIYKAGKKILSENKIDVICGYEVMATPVARKLANEFKKPLIARYQGTFLRDPLNAGSANRLYPHHLKGSKVDADLHVMENDGTGGLEVLMKLGHPREKILFLIDGVRKDIHQIVDKEKIYSQYGIKVHQKTRIILTLSKLNMWKRHDRIIAAMPKILESNPDTYLIITHRGPLRNALEKFASDKKVNNNIIFTGPVPHPELYRLLNSCDVYVNCNDWSNLSNTVLEALECGKPVVSIDDKSLDGIIINRENGLLVDKEKLPESLSDAIISLFDSADLACELSANAKQFATDNILSWEERMRIEVDRIEKLLEN